MLHGINIKITATPPKVSISMAPIEYKPASQLLIESVESFSKLTGFAVSFGGLQTGDATPISAVSGNITPNLRELTIRSGRGLGGQAHDEGRPRVALEYAKAKHITHDYDREVLSEGIITLMAFPVVVSGETRALLYGGFRARQSPNKMLIAGITSIIEKFAQGIIFQEAVEAAAEELLRARGPVTEVPSAVVEEIRAAYAELRSIRSSVANQDIGAQLGNLEAKLAALTLTSGGAQDMSVASLTPREVDVLSQVAMGLSNAEIGMVLGLTEGTVKAYLKSATTKLGVGSRHAAVFAARRAGIIP